MQDMFTQIEPVVPLPQLPNGLKNIALSFSGGGFRAAGFSLGCFSYLENICVGDKKLSEMVQFISSASGGSFASTAIVHAQRKGGSFENAYRNLYNALDGDKLLKRVLEILKTDSIWQTDRPTKDRNFINAFAIAYDELIFGGDCFGVLWHKAADEAVSEICVTATDFTHGQQFRFQHDGTDDYTGEFGNGYLNIREEPSTLKPEIRKEKKAARWEVIKKIKLGDILAASSCFPAGFEPLMYPNDFAWQGKNGEQVSVEELRDALESDDRFINPKKIIDGETKPLPSYGLMDGGIIDNQGIDAFVKAEGRLKSKQKKEQYKALDAAEEAELAGNAVWATEQKKTIEDKYAAKKEIVGGYGFDLFAICDVSSNYTDEYQYPRQSNSNLLLRPSLLHYIIFIVLMFGLGVAGILTDTLVKTSYIVTGAFGLPVVIVCVVLLLSQIKKTVHKFQGKAKPAGTFKALFGKHIWYFINLPLNRVINLLLARAGSLANLAVVLFLKKIRLNSYSNHLSSSLSKSAVEKLVTAAVDENLLSYTNKPGFESLLLNKKSWRQNTINPTVYLLGTKHRNQFEEDLKRENWEELSVRVIYEKKMRDLYGVLQPSLQITAVADIGTNMATTLWFDEIHVRQKMRASLIANGQFTMCHCLLRFAYRFHDHSDEWREFQKDLLEHWEHFQNDPYWLYNKIGDEMAFAGNPLDKFEAVSL